MCLAVPGRIKETTGDDLFRVGKIDFGGIIREARLDFLPEAKVGDYVLVHVGVAISRIDEEEAQRTLELLREAGLDIGEESGTGTP
jgi:hydrogenase expression/formation protein HypC